jgi:GAF domain-containing protein/HAMP domain-containing protein
MNNKKKNRLNIFYRRNEEQRQTQVKIVLNFLLYGNIALLGVAAVIFAIFAIQQTSWQSLLIAAAFMIGAVIAYAITTRLIPQITFKALGLIFNTHVLLLTISALVTDVGILAVILIFVYTLVIATATLNPNQRDFLMAETIIAAIVISLINIYSPFQQLTINWLPFVMLFVIFGSTTYFLAAVLFRILVPTLRTRILILAVLFVLIPLIAVSILQINSTQIRETDQIQQSLKSAADFTANALDQFITSNLDIVFKDSDKDPVRIFLSLPEDNRDLGNSREGVYNILKLQSRALSTINSYALLDSSGKIIADAELASTGNSAFIGLSERDSPHFSVPYLTNKTYVSSVEYDPIDDQPYIYFSAPIADSTGKVLGVIRSRYRADILQNFLVNYVGLAGPDSFPMLVDNNLIILAEPENSDRLYKLLAPPSPETLNYLRQNFLLSNKSPDDQTFLNLESLAKQILNSRSVPIFYSELNPEEETDTVPELVYTTQLPSTTWYLVFSQEQTASLAILKEQRNNSITTATLIAGLIGLIAIVAARSLSNPISKLTETAQKVTLGNLDERATITSDDEMGLLGTALNEMTSRLKNMINTLEATVSSRTHELANQNRELLETTRQLQTISEIARSITGVQELDTFLDNVTVLISERLNFYHVGIFLLEGEYAVLRAANSTGGKKMLSHQHMLKVGQVGIVGYVAGAAKARIALDVGDDPTFFNNPDLPETRSEMALPLQVSNRIIGVLDVQSQKENAFGNKDISLFTTLADQIAIAIDNNRLLLETGRALKDAEDTHRQYLQQEWTREIGERTQTSYLYTPLGVIAQTQRTSEEVQKMIDSGKPITLKSNPNPVSNNQTSTMAIPIIVSGNTIGMIQLQDVGQQPREWSPDEVSAVQAVSDQVSQVLERVRLFEQTVRRADRERKALDITSKIRSTTDAQKMLQIAVEELQQALKASRTQIILQNPETPAGSEPPGDNGNETSIDA